MPDSWAGTMAKGKKGVGGWTWTRNKRYIIDALEEGREIRLVSDPNLPRYKGGNTYKRELKMLKSFGYGWRKVDDYWILIRTRPY